MPLEAKLRKHLSRPMRERMWEAFLEHGTNHSQQALTLPYIINRCEEENVPYRLTAIPGQGYFIEQLPPQH